MPWAGSGPADRTLKNHGRIFFRAAERASRGRSPLKSFAVGGLWRAPAAGYGGVSPNAERFQGTPALALAPARLRVVAGSGIGAGIGFGFRKPFVAPGPQTASPGTNMALWKNLSL